MTREGWLLAACAALFAIALAVFISGCGGTAARTAVVVAQGTDLACRIADTQPEPGWLHLLCQVEEAAEPGVVKWLEMRVPAAQ